MSIAILVFWTVGAMFTLGATINMAAREGTSPMAYAAGVIFCWPVLLGIWANEIHEQ